MGERTVKTHGRKPMMRVGGSEGVKGSPVAFTSFLNPYRPRMPTAMNIYISLSFYIQGSEFNSRYPRSLFLQTNLAYDDIIDSTHHNDLDEKQGKTQPVRS